jgi:hypothetical protein
MYSRVSAIIGLLGAIGAPALAQGSNEKLCSERAASKIVRIAVCTSDAEDRILIGEGERLCDGAMPCGVWFYLSEDLAPTEAPSNHDGLTQKQITDALGVFVAEQGILIRIDEVEG